MKNLKGVFHRGYCNAYFQFQVVAASVRAEWCLLLHVIANKISGIPNRKGPHTDTWNTSLGAPYAAWASSYEHLQSAIRRSVSAAQATVEVPLKYSTWTHTGEQPRLMDPVFDSDLDFLLLLNWRNTDRSIISSRTTWGPPIWRTPYNSQWWNGS